MKDQISREYRETVEQEFQNSRDQERQGMRVVDADIRGDFLQLGEYQRIDPYEIGELEPSWCQQLDTVGMQPHAREYIEREMNFARSERKFEHFMGQTLDHPQGIHFDGRP